MGTISNLVIAGYPLLSEKNSYVSKVVELIFTPEDFIEEERSYHNRNTLIWGDTYLNNYETYNFKGFRQSAKVCIKRLEIYGLNKQKATRSFSEAKRIAKKEGNFEFSIKGITYKSYLQEIEDIIDQQEIHYDQLYQNLRESLITNELLFPGLGLETFLYSVLNCVDPDAEVEYELNDLIDEGHIDASSIQLADKEKIIIITEGKTDSEFISASMKLLYPEVFSYYQFIDFSNSLLKPESNASNLVKLVTTFVALNIKQKIIAIFDNDTAGRMEFNKIPVDRLPENICVMRLPTIKLAKRYPTVGPSGIKKMNVNELACGIEMFLGEDILTENGQLIPVQWRAYNDRMQQYQGELSKKDIIQSRFREKVSQHQQVDSLEMVKILNMIMNAFN